jgi:transcriptional regulator with XRE-family HTH domain
VRVRDAATTVRSARARAGISLRELARRAGTSHSALVAYEAGRTDPSVATLARIVEAAGFALDVQLRPERSVADRGTELVEVLELAARFPARPPARQLSYPPFGAVRPAS